MDDPTSSRLDAPLNTPILVYTRRARVAPKELFVLSGYPNSLQNSCILWIMIHNHGLLYIIIDYGHNLSNDVFLTYLQILRFLQILPNFALFWQNLRDSKGFKGRRRRTEDERTDAHTLQIWGSPTQKAPSGQKMASERCKKLKNFRLRRAKSIKE